MSGHTRPVRFFRNLNAKIAAVPMILTTLVVFVGGTIWTVIYSFTNSKLLPVKIFEWTTVAEIDLSFLRKGWGFDLSYISGITTKGLVGTAQYERLWNNDLWNAAINNLLFFGVMSMVFTIGIGFLLAVLMDQKIRFEDTFRTIMLYPFALSFIVTGLVWQWILNPEMGIQEVVRRMGWEGFVFDPLHNPDTVLYGLLIAGLWQGTGFTMCLMLAGLRGIDEDIWKAARVDGIPRWKTYIFVVIPMMRPVFITTLVLVAAGIIKLYDLVVAQTNGNPGNASQMPAMYVYRYMFTAQNLGQGFAASTMMLLSVLIVLIPWAYLEFGGKKRG